MKRTLHITLIFCMAIAVIAGCRKPNNNRTTDINTGPISTGGQPPTFPGGTQPSFNQLFKELRYTPEVKCVTAGILQVVTFSKGTSLTFYPNSFKNAAGETITSGTVCISMIEMYKPGDMIANGATTTTKDGDFLRSGGQVYINATKDGQKVYANTYGIAFSQPAPSTEPMNLFYGSTDNKDSLVEWTIAYTTLPGTVAMMTITDSVPATPPFPPPPFNPYYVFDSCTDFNWINCDQPYNNPASRKEIKILGIDPAVTWSLVFVVLPEINSVVKAVINFSDQNWNVRREHYLRGVPAGMAASIIAFSYKNDEIYYFEQTGLTVTDNMTITATMEKQTLEYIKTKLLAL